jgi:hypothetical protein
MESHILSFKNWYLKYQLVFGSSKYQLVLRVPIGTSSSNWYFEYQLVLRVPIGTSTTNWYFEYHE